MSDGDEPDDIVPQDNNGGAGAAAEVTTVTDGNDTVRKQIVAAMYSC